MRTFDCTCHFKVLEMIVVTEAVPNKTKLSNIFLCRGIGLGLFGEHMKKM